MLVGFPNQDWFRMRPLEEDAGEYGWKWWTKSKTTDLQGYSLMLVCCPIEVWKKDSEESTIATIFPSAKHSPSNILWVCLPTDICSWLLFESKRKHRSGNIEPLICVATEHISQLQRSGGGLAPATSVVLHPCQPPLHDLATGHFWNTTAPFWHILLEISTPPYPVNLYFIRQWFQLNSPATRSNSPSTRW